MQEQRETNVPKAACSFIPQLSLLSQSSRSSLWDGSTHSGLGSIVIKTAPPRHAHMTTSSIPQLKLSFLAGLGCKKLTYKNHHTWAAIEICQRGNQGFTSSTASFMWLLARGWVPRWPTKASEFLTTHVSLEGFLALDLATPKASIAKENEQDGSHSIMIWSRCYPHHCFLLILSATEASPYV